MPRPGRQEVQVLLQEAAAIEYLASETEIEPSAIEDYWSVSADLIAVVADIEEYAAVNPHADEDDPDLLTLRHRLRRITARLQTLSLE